MEPDLHFFQFEIGNRNAVFTKAQCLQRFQGATLNVGGDQVQAQLRKIRTVYGRDLQTVPTHRLLSQGRDKGNYNQQQE